MTRLRFTRYQNSHGHYRYGWAIVDDFGNLIITKLQQVIDHDYSSTHDEQQLRAVQLPSYYRLPWGLGNSNGR